MKMHDDPAKLRIGATVFFYNSEKRRYAKGSFANQITESEKFEPRKVGGETSASWLVGTDKIPKDPAKRSSHQGDPMWHTTASGRHGGYSYALCELAVKSHLWDTQHRRAIIDLVRYAGTARLMAVAAMFNYKGTDEENQPG